MNPKESTLSTASAFTLFDRVMPIVGGGSMGKSRPFEKNIVLFWSMMWYIFIYSRIVRRCAQIGRMVRYRDQTGFLKSARCVAFAASTMPPKMGTRVT